jgi:hypothetical protein
MEEAGKKSLSDILRAIALIEYFMPALSHGLSHSPLMQAAADF